MEQVFRIEIPIDIKQNADTASIHQLEAALQKVFTSMKNGQTAAKETFQAVERGAQSAESAMKQAANGSEQLTDSLQNVSETAEQTSGSVENVGDAVDSINEGDGLDNVQDDLEGIGRAAKEAGEKANDAFGQAGSSADKFSQRVEKTQRTLRSMLKEKVKLALEAVDKISPVLASVKNGVKSLAGKAWRITVRMADYVTAPFRKLYHMITSPITLALSFAGVGMGAGDFLSTFTSFSAGMSTVQALTGATDDEFQQLTETAENLGATTKFTASEASEGMKYLAMAGWETADIIEAMPGLLNLAAAGATDLGTAADIVSDVMTAMGMSADQASRAADIFAKTATSSNTTIEGLGNTLKYAAPIAHSFGLSLEDVAAAAGLMANAGIKGEMAGTALRASLLRMSSPTSEMQKALDSLGISFTENGGKMKSLGDIIRTLETSFAGLSDSEKLAYAQDIFGTEAASAWLGLISQGADEYDRMAASLYDCAGSAEQMVNTQLDNLTGDMTLLQSAVDGMKISVMKELDPYLRSGVQWLTGKIPQLTEAFTSFVTKGIDKAKELKDFLAGVFNSNEFQHADGFAEKFFVAWDKVIAEPLSEWWQGGGKEKVLDTLGNIGGEIGELLHGVIVGASAVFTGKDIDLDGMNLSGFAQVGAESAKAFAGSFVSSLHIGDLLGELPGVVKAGLFGTGALKVGGGISSAVKTFSLLKTAIRGVSTASASAATATAGVGAEVTAAAAGAAEGASVFSLLGSALSAIPGWGWAAAAGVAAVTAGVVMYNRAQKEQKREFDEYAQKATEATESYRETARAYQEAVDEMNSRNVVSLRVIESAGNAEVIAKFKSDMETEITDKKAEIVVQLAETGNLDEATAQSYVDNLVEIMTKEAKINVLLDGAAASPEQIEAYKSALKDIDSKIVTITAQMAEGEGTMSQTDLENLKTELASLETTKAAIMLELQGSELTPEEVQGLMSDLANLKNNENTILMALKMSGLNDEQIASVYNSLCGIADLSAEYETTITVNGVGTEDLKAYNTQLSEMYQHLIDLSGGVITQEDIDNGIYGIEDEAEIAAIGQNELETQLMKRANDINDAKSETVPMDIEARQDAAEMRDYWISEQEKSAADARTMLDMSQRWSDIYERARAGTISIEDIRDENGEAAQLARDYNEQFGGTESPESLFLHDNPWTFWKSDYTLQEDARNPFASAFEGYSRDAGLYGDYAAAQQETYDEHNGKLIEVYQNEVALATDQATFGTDQQKQTIEQLTMGYADLDEAGRTTFENAIAGINQVNETATYIADEEKTSIGSILGQAQQSVDTAANVEVLADVTDQLETLQTAYSDAQDKAAFNDANIKAVNDALEALGVDKIDSLDQINTALTAIAAIDPSGLDFNAAAESLVTLGGNADDVKKKVEEAHKQLEALAGTYNVVIAYTQRGAEAALPGASAGAVSENAEGGIYDGAFLSWVAEDGPEAIIPLGTERRERGLDLWLRAGEMLGIAEYADGGILSPYADALADLPDEPEDDGAPRPYPFQSSDDSPRSVSITIELPDSPTYNIETDGDSEDIIDKLREHQRELAELFGSAIADQLEDIISNMA